MVVYMFIYKHAAVGNGQHAQVYLPDVHCQVCGARLMTYCKKVQQVLLLDALG